MKIERLDNTTYYKWHKYYVDTYLSIVKGYGLKPVEAYCYHMLICQCLMLESFPDDLNYITNVCQMGRKHVEMERVWQKIKPLFAEAEGRFYLTWDNSKIKKAKKSCLFVNGKVVNREK